MTRYLQERRFYEERYDQYTVEECLRYEGSIQEVIRTKIRKLPKKDHPMVIPNVPYIVAGERYIKRQETIDGWMERDRRKDEMLDNAQQPYSFCPRCSEDIKLIRKGINSGCDGKPDRVEFVLFCKECNKVHRVFEDGTEVPPIVFYCEKCKHELITDVEIRKKGKVKEVIYKEECTNCGFKESKIDREELPTNAQREQFEIARKKYCLSFSEGEDYRRWQKSLHELMDSMKDREQFKEVYDSVENYKKLSLTGLSNHLKPLLKKSAFDKLKIVEPDIGKFVSVDFRIQDMDEEREEYDSKKDLKNALKDTLAATNWSLMSEGLNYRLGILTGRLRGYETSEELIELAKQRTKKK